MKKISEETHIRYECSDPLCGSQWVIFTPLKDSWCPYCGLQQNYAELLKKIKKSERQLQAEDIKTEMKCPNGGWWNPIQKKCMEEDSGNGFSFSKEDLTRIS